MTYKLFQYGMNTVKNGFHMFDRTFSSSTTRFTTMHFLICTVRVWLLISESTGRDLLPVVGGSRGAVEHVLSHRTHLLGYSISWASSDSWLWKENKFAFWLWLKEFIEASHSWLGMNSNEGTGLYNSKTYTVICYIWQRARQAHPSIRPIKLKSFFLKQSYSNFHYTSFSFKFRSQF